MRLAVAILIFIAATSAVDACRPVSPGSSVMDCRSDDQIEQVRAEEVKAKADAMFQNGDLVNARWTSHPWRECAAA